MHHLHFEHGCVQPRIIVALHDHQRVPRAILGRDKPRRIATLPGTADSQALPLSQCVIREAVMAPDDVSVGRLHWSRLLREITREKLAERSLTDKADTGRILLG